ncbi:rab gtpase [Stylonychia lemnae]|uniref:Ras-related protein Rab-7b n=1 Tax=Stylonychia lemnae TaxID=5949 RepID=A0A078A988_STYLE|nr:rab gtpase [Stylonychia lemnae]|eukprot:CDW78137.1 rab gtpase [Stylonychia lemnae]
MQKKKNFLKIVILGDSGVGKTTLLQQFLQGKVTANAKPTIGADFSKKELTVDGVSVTLQIWDTAGQEKFQSLGYAFYRGADCCVLCYDITNKRTFENLDRWKEGFIENAAPYDIQTFPFMLLGNKIDKEYDRKVDSQEAQEWAKQNCDMLFYETSAKEGLSVEQAFNKLSKKALDRESRSIFSIPESIGGASGALSLKKGQEKNSAMSNGSKTKQKSSCC